LVIFVIFVIFVPERDALARRSKSMVPVRG
jgi:hypothetical protein